MFWGSSEGHLAVLSSLRRFILSAGSVGYPSARSVLYTIPSLEFYQHFMPLAELQTYPGVKPFDSSWMAWCIFGMVI
jgi:hypothetical protein